MKKLLLEEKEKLIQERHHLVIEMMQHIYERECPDCAELIKRKAKKCKHCGCELSDWETQREEIDDLEREASALQCEVWEVEYVKKKAKEHHENQKIEQARLHQEKIEQEKRLEEEQRTQEIQRKQEEQSNLQALSDNQSSSSPETRNKFLNIKVGVGVVVCLLLFVGFQYVSKPAPPNEVEAPPTNVAAEAQTPPTNVVAEAQTPQKTIIAGVPDIDMTMVNGSDYRTSVSKNKSGMKYYKKKDYAKAIEYFIESLEHYPGNMLARFNLGCTYSLDGNYKNALDILRQLKEEDCIQCKERLVKSKRDSDFKALWGTDEYEAIVNGVTVTVPDYEDLARQFIKNMGKSYWSEMAGASRAEQNLVVLSSSDHEEDRLITKKREIEKFKQYLKDQHGEEVNMDPGTRYKYSLKCSKVGCCTIKPKSKNSKYGTGRGMAGSLEKVCFRATSSESAYVNVVQIKYSK